MLHFFTIVFIALESEKKKKYKILLKHETECVSGEITLEIEAFYSRQEVDRLIGNCHSTQIHKTEFLI